MAHEIQPFAIPQMRAFVPEKLRPWIIILMVIMVQLSGGVYLAATAEIVGSAAFLSEDVMMAGYASLAGMALNFVLMFRLHFRFPLKSIFLVCGSVIIIANILCMHITNVFWLTLICFIMGFFRMWGTFGCNTTIQLWLTPKRDLSVFFCYIYLLVQTMLQISGLTTIWVTTLIKWEYMHIFVVGVMCVFLLMTIVLFRNFRTMPKLPLYGIDWLGMFMWGGFLLCVIFVAVYGEHYEWWQSEDIRYATGCGLLLLGLNLLRSTLIRHPFIDPRAWTHTATWIPLLLYIFVDILISPSHLFEHIYAETILGYDALHIVSLNWIAIIGTVFGVFFTWRTFAIRKWTYRSMTICAFFFITVYLVSFYFIIDYNLDKSAFIIPIFCRSFGYVVWAIIALTMVTRLPFEYFFHGVSIQAFVSVATGATIGAAVLQHWLNVIVTKNCMLLGSTLDRINLRATAIPAESLFGTLQQQSLIVSMKEILGWLSIIAIVALIVVVASKSDIHPYRVTMPTFRAIRRLVKHELRIRRLLPKKNR